MKISKNKVAAAVAIVVVATCLFGFNGFQLSISTLFTIVIVYVVVDAITEDGVNLGKPGKSIFTSDKPRHYNKYRKAYKNRR
jgi:hypothetical protein